MKEKLLVAVLASWVLAAPLEFAWAATPQPKVAKELYSVLDPRGDLLPVPLTPLKTERPKSLEGKTVYVLENERTDFLTPPIVEDLKAAAPGARVEFRHCPTNNCSTFAEFALPGESIEKKAEALIIGMAH